MSSTELLPVAKQHHLDGRLLEAQRIYRSILESEPDNADVHHLIGLVSLQMGEVDKAIEEIQHAIGINPEFPKAHNNLGVALKEAGKIGEADDAFMEALRGDPEFVDAHYNHATALHAMGRIDDAIDAYNRALELDPTVFEAQIRLGSALRHAGRPEEALAAYRKAVEVAPAESTAHLALGIALKEIGHNDDAYIATVKSVELDPDYAEARYQLATALEERGDTDGACEQYIRATDLKPELLEAQIAVTKLLFEKNDPRALTAQYNLGATLLERGQPEAALKAFDANLRGAAHKTRDLAFKYIAHIQLGQLAAAKALYDYKQIIRSQTIAGPGVYGDVDRFNEELLSYVTTHPTLVREPEGKTTRLGQQSGELLVNPSGPMTILNEVIRTAISDYRKSIPSESTHPFFEYLPEDYVLSGWAVVLDGEGYQNPHIHPDGWLSGVYYVEVPETVSNDEDEHAGWLELGQPDPELFPHQSEPELFYFRPEAGKLILFPSYCYHRTVPFKSEGRRVSIAFDAMPIYPSEASAPTDS
jgi:tetratricopeptide (TPR) repeat protein